MDRIGEQPLQIGGERRVLLEPESKAVLDQWGIPVVPCEVATSSEEAVQLARSLGYPAVLKIVSPDIIHKTDAGGVRLDLRSDEEVRSAFEQIVGSVSSSSPSAAILGVSVQRMVSGIEVALGVTTDIQFGPVLMFGMGGVLVELLEDTAFRLIPVDDLDANEMIREIKGSSLLQGFRGLRADMDSLQHMLVKVSDLVVAYPHIEEMDLNPVFTSPSGSLVADARLVLAGRET